MARPTPRPPPTTSATLPERSWPWPIAASFLGVEVEHLLDEGGLHLPVRAVLHERLHDLAPFAVDLAVPQASPGAVVVDLGIKEQVGIVFKRGDRLDPAPPNLFCHLRPELVVVARILD